jgi:hypothetical protein
LIFVDEYERTPVGVIEDHVLDFRRTESERYEAVGRVGPWKEIHTLATELLHDLLDAARPGSDARPDAIDRAVMAVDGNFASNARLTGDGSDFHDTRGDLRNLASKELGQEAPGIIVGRGCWDHGDAA